MKKYFTRFGSIIAFSLFGFSLYAFSSPILRGEEKALIPFKLLLLPELFVKDFLPAFFIISPLLFQFFILYILFVLGRYLWGASSGVNEKLSDGETFSSNFANTALEKEYTQAEPLRRFLAKFLDLFVAAVILSLNVGLIRFFFPSFSPAGWIIILGLPACLFIDALICAVFGKSFGKYLLKMDVRKISGEMTPLDWVKRAFWSWVYGFAVGLPPIYFITFLRCQNLVSKGRQTAYDKKLGLWVIEEKASATRWLIAILMLVFGFIPFIKSIN